MLGLYSVQILAFYLSRLRRNQTFKKCCNFIGGPGMCYLGSCHFRWPILPLLWGLSSVRSASTSPPSSKTSTSGPPSTRRASRSRPTWQSIPTERTTCPSATLHGLTSSSRRQEFSEVPWKEPNKLLVSINRGATKSVLAYKVLTTKVVNLGLSGPNFPPQVLG